jgi:hypothetical protein
LNRITFAVDTNANAQVQCAIQQATLLNLDLTNVQNVRFIRALFTYLNGSVPAPYPSLTGTQLQYGGNQVVDATGTLSPSASPTQYVCARQGVVNVIT